MFRGNIFVNNYPEHRKWETEIEPHEIVNAGEGLILNTLTGDIRSKTHTGHIDLTSIPVMFTNNVLSFVVLHYETHAECFHISTSGEKIYFKRSSKPNDPTYIGTCYVSIGHGSYYRIGDDLVGDNPPPDSDIVHTDFFKRCKKLLYTTNPDPNWNEIPDVVEYMPHYVDLNGVIHGRNPVFTTRQDKYGNDFTILLDVNLCVFNESPWVCVVYTAGLRTIYDKICELDIEHVEIYPDSCLFNTKTGSYLLNE